MVVLWDELRGIDVVFHFSNEELAWRSVAMGEVGEGIWLFIWRCVGVLAGKWVVICNFILEFKVILRLSSPG